MNKPLYRIYLLCPHCGKESETVQAIIPKPRVRCGDCLMDRVEIVEMKITAAEQLEQQP